MDKDTIKVFLNEIEILRKEVKQMNRRIGSIHANIQFITFIIAIPIIIAILFWGSLIAIFTP